MSYHKKAMEYCLKEAIDRGYHKLPLVKLVEKCHALLRAEYPTGFYESEYIEFGSRLSRAVSKTVRDRDIGSFLR